MIIIWSGLGFLVAVIVFGFSFAFNLAFNAWNPGYWEANRWPFGVSLLVSAVVCWLVGTCLRKRGAQTLIDQATGQETVIDRSDHRLFFIPMHLWGPILAVCGLIVCLVDIVR